MTLQSRVVPTRRSVQSQPTAQPSASGLLIVYRAQLSSLIALERELVALGHLKPEERRVLSREERRSENGRSE